MTRFNISLQGGVDMVLHAMHTSWGGEIFIPKIPSYKITDVAKLSKLKEKYPKLLIVFDNTFASPYNQRPLTFGADIVLHSVTKYIGGHSDVVMGVLCTNNEEVDTTLGFLQNGIGSVPSPFDCYLALRGVKTLALRMERHNSNAMKYIIDGSRFKYSFLY